MRIIWKASKVKFGMNVAGGWHSAYAIVTAKKSVFAVGSVTVNLEIAKTPIGKPDSHSQLQLGENDSVLNFKVLAWNSGYRTGGYRITNTKILKVNFLGSQSMTMQQFNVNQSLEMGYPLSSVIIIQTVS